MASPDWTGFLMMPGTRTIGCLMILAAGSFSAVATETNPVSAGAPATSLPATSQGSQEGTANQPDPLVPAAERPTPAPDPAKPGSQPEETAEDLGKKKLPPLTPDLANLNLAEDLELVTLDTQEKVLLPAGTYRQILRLPIDSPTMRSVQKTRLERRPEVRVADPLPPDPSPEKRPLWIRYESLEKIRINEQERRGGLDLPINGPRELKMRLWYAKSETADVASSVFYFVFGGLGYSTANLLGWSAGNTREIPSDFEYRLIRR